MGAAAPVFIVARLEQHSITIGTCLYVERERGRELECP